ncbi:MAG: hypothetical protein A2341_18820 [Deltaproteobacteria bacterium RIFOXYB12_FULL_58_9]|nr:MAG: hypothetical protein A2341_18820 [Deltaproteobacteria bacterium RIFOXYB12_FULL_58_9]
MPEKIALYFSPLQQTFADLCTTIDRQDWLHLDQRETACCWRGTNLTLCLHLARTIEEVQKLMRSTYYSAILVDCRHLADYLEAAPKQEKALEDFFNLLGTETDRERRYPFRRVAVLVGDADRERVDKLIFRLGQRHIGACLRDRSLNDGLHGEQDVAASDRLIEQLWQFCSEILVDRPKGKKAFNLAGGGISGIYYELGVLKCLNDAFSGLDVRDFDMYFGIGAGAFVGSFAANGFHVDKLIATIGDIKRKWPYSLRLRMRHLNLREIPKRMNALRRNTVKHLGDLVSRQEDLSVASLLDNYALSLGPLFSHNELERALREQFDTVKHTNDFRKLPRKLFVGVTDQDRREHVLLGDDGYDDVPISLAVQASTAIHPFFQAVPIHGRYYADGAITRTSNITASIAKGADLIFVIDPFVPLISDEAGFNIKHSNLWIQQQDIKTLAYTRFAQMSEEILRQNPQVSCYTFVPSNRMRALMTQSPLSVDNFHPIITEAYAGTYRRLTQLEYKIAGELAEHGIQLELKPVAARVEELSRSRKPDANILIK